MRWSVHVTGQRLVDVPAFLKRQRMRVGIANINSSMHPYLECVSISPKSLTRAVARIIPLGCLYQHELIAGYAPGMDDRFGNSGGEKGPLRLN